MQKIGSELPSAKDLLPGGSEASQIDPDDPYEYVKRQWCKQ